MKTEDKEAQARAKLRLALDSWVFGDSITRFEAAHPDIHFGDYDWVLTKVLQRYEMGAARPYGSGYEISVILTFESQAGTEIRRTAKYTVLPPAGPGSKWTILGGAN